ncbi:peptide chain release factor 2 [candidate division KSB3 bacterium]|uniref:Peptide chain release factor 2 n=1 Tax=candidate division KSB3 bacterium TaxID=2044937 RepID=A0A9D5JZM5_9BACT|nr:peptide chain release factor 2 [candidate division KSB3 bacterium]MBD3327070.1 peptide chain release factor 2 [candidate division KSB3 bacterium]
MLEITSFHTAQEALTAMTEKVEAMRRYLDIDACQTRVDQLTAQMAQPSFWDDPDSSQVVVQENKGLQQRLDTWRELMKQYEELQVLVELSTEEQEESLFQEIEGVGKRLERLIATVEFEQMLSGEHDKTDAILSINAGAGGTEAQDWADMLLRMYLRWCERHEFATQLIDILPDQEAGIKNATITVSGKYAYGYLKAEIGVHRLVRISPFDTGKRRHTSFASVMVIPEVDEEIDIDIDEEDLRIDTYRSSGAGGQHVNVTDSAVRITHLPTGIVVQCQNERSQHKNRAQAMKILRARLYELRREEQDEEIEKLQGEKRVIAWGSQIRSYVMHPYQMVKDHRTNHETSNVSAVLDGDLDQFIRQYLLLISHKQS